MSLLVDMEIESTDTTVKRCTQALINCSATGCFIAIVWVKLTNVPTCPLSKPIPVYNVNSTANDASMITDIANVILHYKNHSEYTQLAVTHLGMPWDTTGCKIITQRSTGRQRVSKCLAAHYNVPLVEWKISVTQKYRSQQPPRSTHAN
jgi:hypothetical protein